MDKQDIVYIDMDNTIADFDGHPVFKGTGVNEFTVAAMFGPGFFLSLSPIEGAFVAVRAIVRLGYDVQILSKPVTSSAHSYSEKVEWIGRYFPDLVNKINLTQDKGLFVGGYLIDDDAKQWKDKFEANGGQFIHFDYHSKDHATKWVEIVEFFVSQRGKDVSSSNR